MELSHPDWLRAFKVYFGVLAIGNFAWEALHLPLYTIWAAGSLREKIFAVVHCTGGDIMIALVSLVAALLLIGTRDWPARDFERVALVTIVFGIAYTGFSEWLNVSVRRSWAYSDWMPIIPLGSVRIGLSPLIQWVVVPMAAFAAVRRITVPPLAKFG